MQRIYFSIFASCEPLMNKWHLKYTLSLIYNMHLHSVSFSKCKTVGSSWWNIRHLKAGGALQGPWVFLYDVWVYKRYQLVSVLSAELYDAIWSDSNILSVIIACQNWLVLMQSLMIKLLSCNIHFPSKSYPVWSKVLWLCLVSHCVMTLPGISLYIDFFQIVDSVRSRALWLYWYRIFRSFSHVKWYFDLQNQTSAAETSVPCKFWKNCFNG